MYDEIYRNLRAGQDIFLDISRVQTITADAILYTVSMLEYYITRFRRGAISGNFPDDVVSRRLFVQSGFTKYVRTSERFSGQTGGSVLSVKSHARVMPEVANEVVSFAKSKLGISVSFRSAVYQTLIEVMANTRNHAYEDKVGKKKWWLMAHHDTSRDVVRFAFVDNGAGIPTTLRKNVGERIGEALGWGLDGGLILSALRGEFRTRTGDSHRGKGLPTIHKYVRDRKLAELVIVSNKGLVESDREFARDLNHEFRGTLLSWDFVPANGGDR